MSFADIDSVVERSLSAWRPPPRLTLSAWADRFFYLSAETAAQPGRWTTLPYQKEILDAITDPEVSQVSVIKSARVGYTLCMSAAIGYYIHQDPSSILVIQPTVDDAKNFSKETVAPMLRDVPVLSRIMFRDVEEKGKGPKDPSSTLQHKAFPGGILSLIGANSGAGFRRVSRRVVMFDEVDAYPPSAGTEGDQIKLGMKRSEAFWNRKTIAGSTPLIAGASRIEEMFLAGDQRRYHVPCPHCGYMDILTFREENQRGHWMRWDEGKPESAYFCCRKNGCVIEHRHKRWMVERGEWRPDNPGGDHRSYHLWTALSYAPNASWGQIAAEFLETKDDPKKLKTFVNTTLGETWHERGEAPDWERLYLRREPYQIGSAPDGVVVVTAGVDVQKDRLVWEATGWGRNKESWLVDCGEIYGDTADEATWAKLEELLGRDFPHARGGTLPIAMMAVDSGYNTQVVYNWCRRHPMNRVIATKGVDTARTLISTPSTVDVTVSGRAMKRGYKVWTLGVSIAKSELYGWLRLPRPAEGEDFPPGYCHFPEVHEEYFRQLTAEHLVAVVKRKTGFIRHEWQVLPGRQNHWLDTRVLSRAAVSVLGLDRMPPPPAPARPTADDAPNAPAAASSAPPSPPHAPPSSKVGSWLGGSRPRGGGGDWLRRRR